MKPSGSKSSFQPIEGFEILDRLGSGGMGTVFRARQVSLDRIVALKVLRKSDLKDPLPLERLRREALVTARMDHPNIVKGIDLGETARYFYFVMEYVEGPSVKALLDREGSIPPGKALSIVRDLAEALDHAFRNGIVHRDIKPGNIIIGRGGRAKLADLGLAKGIFDLTVTRDGTTLGTPQYISPEQARDPAGADVRSDIYSLGATFYHMVTGRPAFRGDNVAQVITGVLYGRPTPPEEIESSIDRAISRCISKMMARDPSRRYQTPGDLIRDLDFAAACLAEEEGRGAETVGMSWKDSWAPPGQRAVRAVLAAALLVVAAAVLLSVLVPSRKEPAGRSVDHPPKSPLENLEESYDSGTVPPGRALEMLAALESGAGGVPSPGAAAFRARLIEACRKLIEGIPEPTGDEVGRLLLGKGYEKTAAAIEGKLSLEAREALGSEGGKIPAGLGGILEARASALVRDEAAGLGSAVETRFRALLAEKEKEAEAALGRRDFAAAFAVVASMKNGGKDLEVRAAADAVAKIRHGTGSKEAWFDRVKKIVPSLGDALRSARSETLARLERRVSGAAREAAGEYAGSLEEEIRRALGEADPARLERGLDALVAGAFRKLEKRRPLLPEAEAAKLPDPAREAEAFRPLYEKRLASLAAAERERILLDVEESARRGDWSGALSRLSSREAAGSFAGNETFRRRWKGWIRTLSRVRERALEALEENKGLEVTLALKGASYRGEVAAVDRGEGVVRLEGPAGRPIDVPIDDLDAGELLRWADRSFHLDPVERFLYFYYAGNTERAGRLLAPLESFEEKDFFAARLAGITRSVKDDLAKREAEFDALLDVGLEALSRGDLEGVRKALERLLEGEKRFSSCPSWKRRRRDRERLGRGLDSLEKRAGLLGRLERSFSVPVEIEEENRIRVSYGFDDPRELEDFRNHGLGFAVDKGRLLFRRRDAAGKPRPFDGSVGLRFGRGFSSRDPLSVSFTYRAALSGKGPCLLLVFFYGECVGVHSFPGGRYPGQTAAWTGDLSDWEDHFFFPDLGETKPRKGKIVPLGFSRGERYRITLSWDGSELLFLVDGTAVLRRKPKALKGRWCEIKPLEDGLFDDLEIGGLFRGR